MPSNDRAPSTFGHMLGPDDELRVRALSLPVRYSNGISWDSGAFSGFSFSHDCSPIEGGTSVIFQVRNEDISQERTFALKVLLVDLGHDTARIERWATEKEILDKLAKCEHVPIVRASGELEGFPAVVMDWVDGENLDSVLANSRWQSSDLGPFDLHARGTEAVELAFDVCRALQTIRDHLLKAGCDNPVHGDIKPSNIQVNSKEEAQPEVWVLDFGEATLGIEHDACGYTRRYVSPEVLSLVDGKSDQAVDWRSDQYQAGACLQEMLALIDCRVRGWRPWLRLAIGHPIAAMSLRNLRAVSRRMTSRNPSDRYPSYAKAVAELQRPLVARVKANAFTVMFGCAAALLVIVLVLGARSQFSTTQTFREDALLERQRANRAEDSSKRLTEEKAKLVNELTLIIATLQKPPGPTIPPATDPIAIQNAAKDLWTQFLKLGAGDLTTLYAKVNGTLQHDWDHLGTEGAKNAAHTVEGWLDDFAQSRFDITVIGELHYEYNGVSPEAVIVSLEVNGKTLKKYSTVDSTGMCKVEFIDVRWQPGESVRWTSFEDQRLRNPLLNMGDLESGPLALLKALGCKSPPYEKGRIRGQLDGSEGNAWWKWDITIASRP